MHDLQRKLLVLHQDNQHLNQELVKERERIRQMEQELADVRSQRTWNDAARAIQVLPGLDEEGRKALKQTLQEYIREMDRCIALLKH